MTIAHALFPDQPRETPFFLNSVRKLFAHLLRFHPTPEQLVEWMSDPSQIDDRVKGTPYAATVRQTAPGQREGVLGTMNDVVDTLRLLKTEKDAKQGWTAREWVARRQGWIFLTSTPETRDSLIVHVDCGLHFTRRQVSTGIRQGSIQSNTEAVTKIVATFGGAGPAQDL